MLGGSEAAGRAKKDFSPLSLFVHRSSVIFLFFHEQPYTDECGALMSLFVSGNEIISEGGGLGSTIPEGELERCRSERLVKRCRRFIR